MQHHRGSFFSGLQEEFDVEVVRCDGAIADVRKWTVEFLMGWTAVILVRSPEHIAPVFRRISEQAVAGIYGLNQRAFAELPDLCRTNSNRIEGFVESQPEHLFYSLDEDAADSSGLIPQRVSIGPSCPPAIASAVKKLSELKVVEHNRNPGQTTNKY